VEGIDRIDCEDRAGFVAWAGAGIRPADDIRGDPRMANRQVDIRQLAPIEVLAIEHIGPYPGIGGAFTQLAAWVGARGLFGPHTRCLAVFHDDPETTPADQLRSHACFALGPGTAALDTTPPVAHLTIAGGLHAVYVHQGPYATLPAAYRWLFQEWLPASGRTLAEAPSFEIYPNDPQTTPPEQLLTEIHLPLR
jgi:AraC family transcriptional regulator